EPTSPLPSSSAQTSATVKSPSTSTPRRVLRSPPRSNDTWADAVGANEARARTRQTATSAVRASMSGDPVISPREAAPALPPTSASKERFCADVIGDLRVEFAACLADGGDRAGRDCLHADLGGEGEAVLLDGLTDGHDLEQRAVSEELDARRQQQLLGNVVDEPLVAGVGAWRSDTFDHVGRTVEHFEQRVLEVALDVASEARDVLVRE